MIKKITMLLLLVCNMLAMYGQRGDGITRTSADADKEVVKRLNESELDARKADVAEYNARSKAINSGLDGLGKYLGMYKSAKELYESLAALNSGECIPDFTTAPQAMIPTNCIDTLGCEKCYREAYQKLQSVRKRLARLKCLGNATKNFVTKSIAFGDQVSGIHAVQGLAWQKAKKGINESYAKFKVTYDNKYKELMEKLMEALQAIDACEAKNGQPDWFQKFGFMYAEFMAEKYKRGE